MFLRILLKYVGTEININCFLVGHVKIKSSGAEESVMLDQSPTFSCGQPPGNSFDCFAVDQRNGQKGDAGLQTVGF